MVLPFQVVRPLTVIQKELKAIDSNPPINMG